MRLAGVFCELRVFGQLLLPSALTMYRRVFSTHANYRAPRSADKVLFESRSGFKSRFLMWARDDRRERGCFIDLAMIEGVALTTTTA